MEHYKIINDPVHGFISIPLGLISSIIEHPWFQRLRDIKQLGVTNLVYPGAVHSRLSHALGAMHLMREALTVLRKKGVIISHYEEESALAAILLHDIGHGPFSHTLERSIVRGSSHEQLSLSLMNMMNDSFGGSLDLAIKIFEGKSEREFLHQLVSGQLDTDRLDYLKRDSFFSGVAEGMIGLERIIEMLSVKEDKLVVEEKGIYSIEKFLISRRLMYWQVYLHKTVVAAEQLLHSIFTRAREIVQNGYKLPGAPALLYFLSQDNQSINPDTLERLNYFTQLDDSDITSAIKQWQESEDLSLSILCKMLVTRNLPKLRFMEVPPSAKEYEEAYRLISSRLPKHREVNPSLFIWKGEVLNHGYDTGVGEIMILTKGGQVKDVYDISEMLRSRAFSQITKKYFLCTAKF